MYTMVERPYRVNATELDEFLACGWYRIGQEMVSCRFVVFDGVLRSAIWTRLPLDRWEMGRNLAKRVRRNDRRFTVTYGPMRHDEEHEALYQRYRQHVKGDRPATLHQFLFANSDRDAFETFELTIRDESDALVAFSWFDLGERSLQSLLGVYEPERKKESLGLYTMVLEARYAKETGRDFHYSGYVLPGAPQMDYKLKLQPLEFWDPDSRTWIDWQDFDAYELSTDRMHKALVEARQLVDAQGIQTRLRQYRMFDVGAWNPELAHCMSEPLLLECGGSPRSGWVDVLTWNVGRGTYAVSRCARSKGLVRAVQDAPPREVELLVVGPRTPAHSSPEQAVEALVTLKRKRK